MRRRRQEILSAAWAVAREQGLAQLTLREVAERVGMRAPSLYTHFASKNAIYDAMFADAWTQYLRGARGGRQPSPGARVLLCGSLPARSSSSRSPTLLATS